MILFEHLFIVIAKPYIKIWSKYENWWVAVRFGITLLVLSNLLSFLAILKDKIFISIWVFMFFVTIFYLIITFAKPILNDKNYVLEYEMIELWRKLSLRYIVGSALFVILIFWIFVVGI